MTLHESADKFSLTKVEHSHPLVSKIRGGDGPSLCVFDFFYIFFYLCHKISHLLSNVVFLWCEYLLGIPHKFKAVTVNVSMGVWGQGSMIVLSTNRYRIPEKVRKLFFLSPQL